MRRQGDRLREPDLRPGIIAKRRRDVGLQSEIARQRHAGRQAVGIVEHQHETVRRSRFQRHRGFLAERVPAEDLESADVARGR